MKGLQQIVKFMADRPMFVRSVYAETLLEDFFIAAVTSVLAIRLYLQVTGYPQIAWGGLHIAHVLWGGLLMLVALVTLASFLDHSARELATVIGGIGFGAFIDELGKFITRDNNYFYKPTVALIYVAFVLLFFLMRLIIGRRGLSRQERLANVFEIAEQASVRGLHSEERQLALRLLEEGAKSDVAPLYLEAILLQTPAVLGSRLRPLIRVREMLNQFCGYVATKWWFVSMIVGFFALVAITSLSSLVAVIDWTLALALWLGGGAVVVVALFWSRRTNVRYPNILISVAIVIVSGLMTWAILGNLKQELLSLVDWAQLASPSISGVVVIIGLLLIPFSRLRAYRMFRHAILISIFFTQVLAFYEHQLLALVGLLVNIAILVALRYVVRNEQVRLSNGLPEARQAKQDDGSPLSLAQDYWMMLR